MKNDWGENIIQIKRYKTTIKQLPKLDDLNESDKEEYIRECARNLKSTSIMELEKHIKQSQLVKYYNHNFLAKVIKQDAYSKV